MSPLAPSLRYERKFVVRGVELNEVLALVRRHRSGFRAAFPARQVNNIYLDSPALRDYQDHIEGCANRCKTRVRWYGPPRGDIERPTLERKIKRGGVGGKEAHSLPRFHLDGDSTRSLLLKVFNHAPLPEMLRSGLHWLEPSLFNCYQRHYFVSANGRFRLTVDSDLKFAGIRSNSRPAPASDYASNFVILELKYGQEFSEQAGEVGNALPFRLTRCSKYVLGIQSTATLGTG